MKETIEAFKRAISKAAPDSAQVKYDEKEYSVGKIDPATACQWVITAEKVTLRFSVMLYAPSAPYTSSWHLYVFAGKDVVFSAQGSFLHVSDQVEMAEKTLRFALDAPYVEKKAQP